MYYPNHGATNALFLCKYNSQGKLQWLDSLEYYCESSVTDANGNTYLACNWHLLKYDKDGNKLWDITYKNFKFWKVLYSVCPKTMCLDRANM